MNELENKVAIITGGGRGIGRATAELFAAEGAIVVAVARTKNEVEETVASINDCGGRAIARSLDVGDEEAVETLFTVVKEHYGTIDVLVNAAGTIEVIPFAEMTTEIWDEVIRVNVRGTMLCCRAAFRQMIAAGRGGSIVNISSLSGVRGPEKFPGFSAYIVSKYGVLGLSESLAVEGRPYKIRVNTVSPGAVDTVMLRKAAPFLRTETSASDVARTLLYLSSDQAQHITGANVEIFSNA